MSSVSNKRNLSIPIFPSKVQGRLKMLLHLDFDDLNKSTEKKSEEIKGTAQTFINHRLTSLNRSQWC